MFPYFFIKLQKSEGYASKMVVTFHSTCELVRKKRKMGGGDNIVHEKLSNFELNFENAKKNSTLAPNSNDGKKLRKIQFGVKFPQSSESRGSQDQNWIKVENLTEGNFAPDMILTQMVVVTERTWPWSLTTTWKATHCFSYNRIHLVGHPVQVVSDRIENARRLQKAGVWLNSRTFVTHFENNKCFKYQTEVHLWVFTIVLNIVLL